MSVKTLEKNLYEITVIIKSTVGEKNLDRVLEQLEESIKNYSGEIQSSSEPIYRKLAYRINGIKDGFLVTFNVNAPSDLPSSLNRSFSIMDEVLRHMVIKKG